MSGTYIVDNTEGSVSFRITPGTLDGPGGVNRNTDLYLYGQRALKWGEGTAENMLRLTESFACPQKEPTDAGYDVSNPKPKDEIDLGKLGLGITTPLNGQLWYNTTTKVLYTYDKTGNIWYASNGIQVDSAPATPIVGSLSYNSNFHAIGVGQLTIYNGTSFVSVAQEYVRLAGDTMTGNLDMGTNSITNSSDPTNPQDLATKNYVDAAIATLNNVFANLFGIGSYFFGPDPSGVLPGTWVLVPAGTFLMATGNGSAGAAGSVGGANLKTISSSEMPVHNHGGGNHYHANQAWSRGTRGPYGGGGGWNDPEGEGDPVWSYAPRNITSGNIIANAGSGAAKDWRPQYESAPVWKRTA